MTTETDVRMMQLLAGKEPQAMECEQPLEAGKGKEMDVPVEPPEGIKHC